MKKADLNRIFSIVFILLLILPFPCYFAIRGLLDSENRENRELASMPDAKVALSEWPGKFEDFFNDHAAFRTQLMQLNATINLKIFGSINSESVLLGKNNWLFFKNASDSKSLDDYQGINAYSDEQCIEIADNLTMLRDNLAKQGIDFAVIIAPNKEKIYFQYMPDSIPIVNEEGRAETLCKYVNSATDITFLYPKQELLQGAERAQIYYKYDTHWNDVGALIATRELLKATNAIQFPFSYDMITEKGSAEITDLANMASIYAFATDDKEFTVPKYGAGINALMRDSTQDGYYHQYYCEQSKGRLLMLRDSFGIKMAKQLAKSYKDSFFVHLNAFDENTIKTIKPQIFVWEIAERNLDRLIDYLPRLVLWSETL